MCNCLNECAAGVLKHLKDNFSEIMDFGENKAECTNVTFQITAGKMTLRTLNHFEVEATPIKKDGTRGKPRKVKMPVLHAYCPSCGKPFKEEKINNPDDLTSGQ